MFAASVVAAQKYMEELSTRGKASRFATARRNAFDPIVYSQIRDVLGGCAKWIVTGGAPLDPNLMAFFRGAGVPVYEGYGLTETTAPCAFNPLGVPYHQGSVGIPFPGFQVRIGDGNEIQVKGTAVFPATTRTKRPPRPRSHRTAGMRPAIWDGSMTMGSSTSSAARRTSSSPPAARTSPRSDGGGHPACPVRLAGARAR